MAIPSGSPWTDKEVVDARLPWAVFGVRYPHRSYDAWRNKRQDLAKKGLYLRHDTPPEMPAVEWNKHQIEYDWRETAKRLIQRQQEKKASSGSQDAATVFIDTTERAGVLFFSDAHIGSWGTDYQKFLDITDFVITHKIWVGVLGDMEQMAIKLRNVLEVNDGALDPREQDLFMEHWLEEIAPQVLFCTWDNHAVMRQEAAIGYSPSAALFRKKVIYHSGIGHIDLLVGQERYTLAVTHRFRGRSEYNPVHSQMKYGKFQGQDRELMVAGDSHVPGITYYTDGPTPKLAINCGTLQTDSGYAKRFFSLFTHDWQPIVLFSPDKHLMVALPTLEHYLAHINRDAA